MTTFELLHSKIQKVIYKMGWNSFRTIQDEAIEYLIKTEGDLIISAPTATGKTEACFLPIISNIINDENDGIKILYISPLKALINDQFSRIETMCEELKFPIVKWHGDANQTDKNNLIKAPDGILLITPESIEALFVNRYRQIEKMFKNLQYIVIDEIHSLVEAERGNHLFSLINRIETIINKKVIKIALSATINDAEPIKKWLNYDNPESVKVIKSNESINNGLNGAINGYDLKEYNEELLKDLFNDIKCNKNLIFENSKNNLERYCVNIKEISKKEKILNRFFIHHGSLSKEIRESTENKLKKEKDISVFCSSTLELGIDIGDIDKILFLNAPHSVSSTIQRLGRSGRKENASRKFKMFIQELPNAERLSHSEKLRTNIVQSIAIIELLAREKWCEPLSIKFDYSTIIHQILSYLGGTGGAEISNIYDIIIKQAFKDNITKTKFLEILKSLRDNQIIYQNKNNLITLDKKGENLVHNYKFYPAFMSSDNYEVNCDGMIIGFVDLEKIALQNQDNIILAGSQWIIISILVDVKRILVKKSNGGKPIFTGESELIIHKKVHEKMKEIFENQITNIPYINDKAKLLLDQGIKEYQTFKDKFLLIFGGTKIQNTIKFILSMNLKSEDSDLLDDLKIGFYHFKGKDFLLNILKEIKFDNNTFYNIFSNVDIKKIQKTKKFDNLLSKELLIEEYVSNNFDVKGAEEVIAKIS